MKVFWAIMPALISFLLGGCSHFGGGTGSARRIALQTTGQVRSFQHGDDGYYRNGLHSPDPRFQLQDDAAIVVDNLTGLMWVRNAQILGRQNWSNSVAMCENLTYAGYDDWRLPNLRELLSLIDYGYSRPGLPVGHPFLNVVNDYYWTSTTREDGVEFGWFVTLNNGDVSIFKKETTCNVLPVRGGMTGRSQTGR